MDIKRFKENIISLTTTPEGDAAFSTLRIVTHGMAGIRTSKLLNFACRCMEQGEFYLEVGTFSGYTLISAGHENNSLCIGVDDLSLKEVIREDSRAAAKDVIRNILNRHLGEYGSANCRFIESDFRNITLQKEAVGKLAALFIDGNHTYEDVKATMDNFGPFLATNAVLIFDDVQFGNIPQYIQEMWSGGDYEMLLYMVHTPHAHDREVHKNMPLNEYIANGICVMAKKEKINV